MEKMHNACTSAYNRSGRRISSRSYDRIWSAVIPSSGTGAHRFQTKQLAAAATVVVAASAAVVATAVAAAAAAVIGKSVAAATAVAATAREKKNKDNNPAAVVVTKHLKCSSLISFSETFHNTIYERVNFVLQIL